jgi:hypothetical protein
MSEQENEKKRKRYAEDPGYREMMLAKNRAYYWKTREKMQSDPEFLKQERTRTRVNNWRSKSKITGITGEQYERMLVRQGGACKICKKKESKALCLDHDHATQWVRGLLCRKCNFGLGAFDDDPARLIRAAGYLVISRLHERASRFAGWLFGRVLFCRNR